MSHRRSTINSQDGKARFIPKNHQKFVPKAPNFNHISLSSSLRQSDSDSTEVSSGSAGRIKMGDHGQWVPRRNPVQGGGNFVKFLPQDEAVAAGLGAEDGGLDPVESQRVVDLLNKELARLLKLNPREFWREVANDASLHEFLDSFLQFRSRWYDFPFHGVKGIVAGVIVGELELSRRVFMVLYRISSNRDPGARAADSLSQKDHGVLLQDKRLLELPKLLDICAIYGHENPELTKTLVGNAVKAQPWIPERLNVMLHHLLGILHTMYHRCKSSLETLLSSGNSADNGSRRLHADFLEVMDFINDGVMSLDAFMSAYNPAALSFACPVEMSYGNDELLSSLVRLHDSLLPSLLRGFKVLFKDEEYESVSDITTSLNMLSTRIVNFCWKILDMCYLSNKMFINGSTTPDITKMLPSSVEDPVIRADILMQTLRDIGGVSENTLDNKNRLLQRIERNHRLIDRLRDLQSAGWLLMDDEQFQYLSMITLYSPKPISVKEQPQQPTSVVNTKELIDEDAIVMQSKISQIKDLFPDYGNGFLAACLEAYNQNPEEVIQRILEGSLHDDLKQLDTSLETMPQPKLASTLSRKDKGKGKLVESPVTTLDSYKEQLTKGPSLPASSTSSSSTSSTTVGRFVRKAKDDTPDYATLDRRTETDKAKNAALLAQYEYDDEYDDSFDDLGLSVGESTLEESETFGNRVGSNSGVESEPSPKWGSRKKPQYYVKDGKNYSYKVTGSVAVANINEASLVKEAQGEMIHGLGRGGNVPLGAVKKLTEYQQLEEQDDNNRGSNVSRAESGRNSRGQGRGRGGRGGRGQDNMNNNSDGSEGESRGNTRGGGNRGRGRGRRGGGGRNHHHKDGAMRKHMASVSGF